MAKFPKSMQMFVFGGLSGMGATLFVHPVDLVKVRMQMSGSGSGSGHQEYRNSLDVVRTVVKHEGVLGMYKGLGAALLRQATYTTGRLGVYMYLVDLHQATFQRRPKVAESMAMGILAGACGAFVGTPAEVVLIRMSSDGRLPPAERRNYTNVVNALTRIVREEGVTTLWRGSIPTVVRAMVANMTQLASYSQLKDFFKNGPLQIPEGLQLQIMASMASALLTTITSLPMDIAKTRIQNMKVDDGGKPAYNGMMDAIVKITRQDGVLSLWKGFVPYLCRLGPHTVLCFVFLERLNKMYNDYVGRDTAR